MPVIVVGVANVLLASKVPQATESLEKVLVIELFFDTSGGAV